MIDLSTLKNWFAKGKRITQPKIWGLIDSFRHKAEPINIEEVEGLTTALTRNLGDSDLVISETGRVLKMKTNTTTAGFDIHNLNDKSVLSIDGQGNVKMGSGAYLGSFTKSFNINSAGHSRIELNGGYGATGNISLTRRQGYLGHLNDNAIEVSQKSFADGNVMTYKQNFVNPSSYYGYSGIERCKEAGFIWYKDRVLAETMQFAIKPDNAIEHYCNANLVPVRQNIPNGYVMIADRTGAVAHPSFFTSDGNKIKLFQQELKTNPTNAEIATFLANIGLARLI